jgi:protein involved in polysaccharide export with SLBB domain
VQKDGTVRLGDMALFYNANSLEANPYLHEGERVFVPPTKEIVEIVGAVNYPGSYDYVPGDNLGTLVDAAGGFSRGADSARIELTRFTDDLDALEVAPLRYPDDAGFAVEKDDRVLVKALQDYRMHRNVAVSGEVKWPGIYPIRKDKTYLRDIVQAAGGLTEHAFLEGSYVVRVWQMSKPGPQPSPDRMLRTITQTGLRAAELHPSELSYIKSELLESEGQMSVDFSAAMEEVDDINNVVLRDGDRIVIARKSLSVRVMGAVARPGLVSHAPGKGIHYYLRSAGGFNRRARQSRVLVKKAGTEVFVKPRTVQGIDAGDIILVPERRYRDAFTFTRDVIGIVSSVATIILIVFTISNSTN